MMKKRSNQSRFFFLLKLFYCSAIAGSCFLDCRFVNTTIHHFIHVFVSSRQRSGTDLPGDDGDQGSLQLFSLEAAIRVVVLHCSVDDIDVGGTIIYFLVCLLANRISSLCIHLLRHCILIAIIVRKERHGPTKQALKICSKIERNSRLNS